MNASIVLGCIGGLGLRGGDVVVVATWKKSQVCQAKMGG
jgi:hypothetical protein